MFAALILLSAAQAALPTQALTALRRGDCAAALQHVPAPDSAEAALARTRCGAPEGAESQLPEAGALAPYLALALAEAVAETDPERAVTLLSGLTLTGAQKRSAELLQGRALVQLERSLEARDVLRPLLSGEHAAEALHLLAMGAEDRGDTAAAIDAYQTNWARRVASPFSDQAPARLKALGAPVPDYSSESGRSLALQRARNLVKAYRAPEAIALFDGVAEVTQDTSQAWTYELSMALFKAKDYPRSMATMAQLKPTEPGTRGGAETLYHYALGTSRTGDYAAAATYYSRLTELYPSSKRADTASFKLGYLDYDEGKLETAIVKLGQHLERVPKTRHLDEALWFIAWSQVRLGQDDQALASLNKLLKLQRNSSLAPGALYWKARLLGRSGDTEGEQAALEKLLNSYPATSQAWLAAERLGRRFEGLGPAVTPALPADFVSANPELELAQALLGAGQFDWARGHLLQVLPKARGGGSRTAVPFAHALIEAGAFKEATALARKHCSKPWSSSANPAALQACYPRPEFLVVSTAASEYGLDPLLPYAIMTAESALDPSVTSPAGARGLMQLMPTLAAELHALRLPQVVFHPDLLYVAGYNAWLGTTELGRLSQRFQDSGVTPHLPLAIAAYNGGPEAVERWLQAYDEPPEADEFAESISYTETRRYVRRVLGYLMAYRWVYGDS